MLSNIVLDELDKELERRDLSFVRYADDCIIFCSSQRAANRVYSSITKFINNRLHLRINEEKSRICKGYALNYLGHRLLNDGSLGLSQESESRFKAKIKQLTKRNKGISFESLMNQLKSVMRGWLYYFRYAKMSSKLKKLDGWIRRRLRCFRIRQCKRAYGIVQFFRKLGHREASSWKLALSGKGWWRKSNTPASNEAMNIDWFTQMGYYSLTDNYIRLQT